MDKLPGEPVTGATLNRTGWFTMRADRVGDDTALAGIIRLVDEATSTKAPIEKIADRISGVFVPVVIVIAVATFAVWSARRTVAGDGSVARHIGAGHLVPLRARPGHAHGHHGGHGRGRANGILIKSAEALETAHDVRTVVLDKTGTVTQGAPSVTDVLCAEGVRSERLLELAVSLESRSEHPLARAVMAYAREPERLSAAGGGLQAGAGPGSRRSWTTIRSLAGNLRMMEAPRHRGGTASTR